MEGTGVSGRVRIGCKQLYVREELGRQEHSHSLSAADWQSVLPEMLQLVRSSTL